MSDVLFFTIYVIGVIITFWVGKLAIRNLFVYDEAAEALEFILSTVIALITSWLGIIVFFIAWLAIKIARGCTGN